MMVHAKDRGASSQVSVDLIPGIERASSIKILGVTVENNLSFKLYVTDACQSAAKNLYALKLLQSKGMDKVSLNVVCQAFVLSKLVYASPAWWWFTSAEDRDKVQAILSRARRWGYTIQYNQNL